MQGGFGLTALLPQPKTTPTEPEGRRTTTSSMVPYTLSKRRQKAIAAEKKAAARTRALRSKLSKGGERATGGDSDSDDEPISFFSHLDDSKPTPSTPTPSVPQPVSNSRIIISPTQSSSHTMPQSETNTTDTETPCVHKAPAADCSSVNHKPYQIATSISTEFSQSLEETHPAADTYQWYKGGYQCSGQHDPNPQDYYSQHDPTGQGYPTEDERSVPGYPSESPQEGIEERPMPGPGPGLSIDEQAVSSVASEGVDSPQIPLLPLSVSSVGRG